MIKKLKEVVGKRLSGVAENREGDELLLCFEDGSMCQLSVNYDDDDPSIVACETVELNHYEDEVLLAAGAVTSKDLEERDRRRIDERAKQLKLREARDRETYEQLKRRFEPE